MPQQKLTFSPRLLQGLLTALGKRAFSSSAKEREENEAFSNAALLSQMGVGAEAEIEITIIEAALRAALTFMWTDESFRTYLSRSGDGDHNGVAPLELSLTDEQVGAECWILLYVAGLVRRWRLFGGSSPPASSALLCPAHSPLPSPPLLAHSWQSS